MSLIIQPAFTPVLLQKVINIGVWNMDTTPLRTISHGLTFADIRAVKVAIQNDTGNAVNDFLMPGYAGTTHIEWDSSFIYMERGTGGYYDSASYNGASNRGWVTLFYLP